PDRRKAFILYDRIRKASTYLRYKNSIEFNFPYTSSDKISTYYLYVLLYREAKLLKKFFSYKEIEATKKEKDKKLNEVKIDLISNTKK
ncbi:hypothetical protein N7539_008124, partial [Penicillium diatomitis]